VFRELTRVKQYFEKIKVAESAGSKPITKLDKAAAGRFIKHALVLTLSMLALKLELTLISGWK
jgi:bacterioferritin (cytochrome b1)